MSALGGILRFDGAPVEVGDLDLLDRGLAYLGPDGSTQILDDSVGMVFRSFHTTRESRVHPQPRQEYGCLLAFDGRFDNRDELAATVREEAQPQSDAQLLLNSYGKWGADCVSRFVGDYAFALWDSQARSLLLARDAFGVRPLYYHVDRTRIVWASNIEALLRCRDVPRDLDETYIGLYLAFEPDGSITPFKEIRAVPPGGVCTVAKGQIACRKYYDLSSHLTNICYKTDAEYEEKFRQLFTESVKARLRSDHPVMAELSGGMDSSSIVCIADKLIHDGEGACPKLETLSFVFDRAEQADERRFIKEIECIRSAKGFHLREDDDPILATWPDPGFVSFPSSIFCFGGRIRQLLEIMNRVGARVLLSGRAGDHLLLSEERTPLELADLFRRGEMSTLVERLIQWGAAEGRSVFELLWNAAVKPNFPKRLRSSVTVPRWINPEFARRIGLRDVIFHMRTSGSVLKSPSSESRYADVMRVLGSTSSQCPNYVTTLGCIEVRYPFLHRPFVEFLLSVPTNQLMRPGETRTLHRRALKGILPEVVRLRRDKRGPDQAVYMAINDRWARLTQQIADSKAHALGYTEASELQTELERARHGSSTNMQALLRFLSLDVWLRNLDRWTRGDALASANAA